MINDLSQKLGPLTLERVWRELSRFQLIIILVIQLLSFLTPYSSPTLNQQVKSRKQFQIRILFSIYITRIIL